jgi:hypothetical protein
MALYLEGPVAFKTVSWAQGIRSDGKGHTYIGTDSGLVELHAEPGQDGFAVRIFPQALKASGPGAYGVLVDGDILWYGCGEQLCRMDRDRTIVFGRDNGLPDRVCLGIQKDRDGNLWVRAKNAGVFVLPVGQTRFRRPDAPIPGIEMGPAVSRSRFTTAASTAVCEANCNATASASRCAG